MTDLAREHVPDTVKTVKAALEADPRVSDVEFYGHSNEVLRFTYRYCFWRAGVYDNEVRVSVPSDSLLDHVVGTFSVDSPLLALEIREAIDEMLCPPVRVTEWGDRVVFDQRKSDEDVLGNSALGWHAECRGWIDAHSVSSVYRVLSCRSCNLRVPIPKWAKTIGLLRSWSKGEGDKHSWVPVE